MRPFVLLLVGVIHLLPVVGALGGAPLRSLYGLGAVEPNVELLLRHRAALFGVLGAYCAWAAFEPRQHLATLLAGLVSTGSFLVLAAGLKLPEALVRVVWVDRVAVALLLVGPASLRAGTG